MATAILQNFGTTITWQDTGGAGNTRDMGNRNVTNGNGRNGALNDWGAAPRTDLYHIKARCTLQATPTLGAGINIYIREAGIGLSATDPTNDDGTGDVALSAPEKTYNLLAVLVLKVDEATAGIVLSAEGFFRTAARHFGPTMLNRSGATTTDSDDDFTIAITPVFAEAQ